HSLRVEHDHVEPRQTDLSVRPPAQGRRSLAERASERQDDVEDLLWTGELVPAATGRVAGVDGAIVRGVAVERMVAQAGAVGRIAFVHGAGVAVVAIATRGLVNAGPRGSIAIVDRAGVVVDAADRSARRADAVHARVAGRAGVLVVAGTRMNGVITPCIGDAAVRRAVVAIVAVQGRPRLAG